MDPLWTYRHRINSSACKRTIFCFRCVHAISLPLVQTHNTQDQYYAKLKEVDSPPFSHTHGTPHTTPQTTRQPQPCTHADTRRTQTRTHTNKHAQRHAHPRTGTHTTWITVFLMQVLDQITQSWPSQASHSLTCIHAKTHIHLYTHAYTH